LDFDENYFLILNAKTPIIRICFFSLAINSVEVNKPSSENHFSIFSVFNYRTPMPNRSKVDQGYPIVVGLKLNGHSAIVGLTP